MADEDNTQDDTQAEGPTSYQSVLDVELEVTAVLGSTLMKVSQLLKMGRGAVLMLDTSVNDDIEMMSNGKLIASGEVVVLEDHIAVSMNKVYKSNL